MQKQPLLRLLVASLAAWASATALAQSGFYGGVSLRDRGDAAAGLKLGALPLAWDRFASPIGEDTQQRALVFGGYRWKSDVAVEAAFNTGDSYALPPSLGGRASGVGLTTPDAAARAWNADVYTSWEFIRSVSLYGRLGYVQSDTRALFAVPSLVPGDPRRQRDGVNYGVGLRYDMTRALGLRVEYSRFGRFAGDSGGAGPLPESDQLTIGVQFKF